MGCWYKPSLFNYVIRRKGRIFFFNGVTGGLLRLRKSLFEKLESSVLGVIRFDKEAITDRDILDIFGRLCRGNYVVKAEVNELDSLRKRYKYGQKDESFHVTVATTLDCNMECYYCYQDKKPVYLGRKGCDEIYHYVTQKVEERAFKKVYMQWYGGEPMLNKRVVSLLSHKLIDFCNKWQVEYDAEIISNGTLWPENPLGFIQENKIIHVQFTLDGLPERHDARRRFREGLQRSSFEEIVKRVDAILGHVALSLRINLDAEVSKDIPLLVEFFLKKGWLRRGTRFYPYLAPLRSMTPHCAFLKEGGTLPARNFAEATRKFRRDILRHVDAKDIKCQEDYPIPLSLTCAAVSKNSVVFGPDGLMYKCGLDVGFPGKSHGHVSDALMEKGRRPSPILERWMSYDPFRHPKCSRCHFLPVCMGGCPLAYFEGNDYFEEECKYRKNEFKQTIKAYIDVIDVMGC